MQVIKATILCIGMVFLAACEKQPTELRLVVPTSITDQEIARDLVELTERESRVQIVLTSIPEAGESALDSLMAGTADIALVSNTLPFREGIATVMPFYPTILHIAYREGRDASSGRTLLQGAKIFAGPVGSGSRLIFENITRRLKLDKDDFSYEDTASDEMDVAIVFSPVSPKLLAGYPDFRLFSLGSPEDIGQGSIVDAAVLLNPSLMPFVIPQGTYGLTTTPQPVVTVAVDKLLVARNDLDSSVVYDLINEILRLRPALAAKRPGLFARLSTDFDASRSTFILHPGTQAYLQRDAPTIYERYSGVAEVGVTVMITVFSAIFAGVRIFRLRRKNRIDTFYKKVIDLRNSINDSTTVEDRARVVGELRALQNTAFDALIDERLAADESFQIFIALSNDAIDRLAK